MAERSNIYIELDGMKQYHAMISKLGTSLQTRINSEAITEAGKVLKRSVQDHLGRSGIRVRTGNLKRSISQQTPKLRQSKYGVATYIYTNRTKGFHAHLLEFGHNIVVYDKQPYNPKTGRFSKPPKFFNTLKKVGFVRARPFFRPAVDESSAKVIETYGVELMKRIEAEVRP